MKETKVKVYIDLLGYGIVELPVAYRLTFTDQLPRTYRVECHINSADQVQHSWLFAPDFRLYFSEMDSGKGHVVCFGSDGPNKNVYYQTMLNVVSDYIFIKEKFFV